MHRRHLLFVSAAGLAHAAVAIGAAGCRKQDAQPSSAGPGARVRARGKPLLLFVGSPGDWRRGDIFGQLLCHSDDEVMAALALCDVVCLSRVELQRSVPDVREPEGALAVLVEPSRLPPVVVSDELPDASRRDPTGEHERAVMERVRLLGERVRAVVAPDVATLRRRAADCCGVLTPNELALVQSSLGDPARLEPALAERAAALLLLAAEDAPERAARVGYLADIAVRRLRERPPPGARWAVYTGCGADVEGCEGERAPSAGPRWRGPYSCGIAYTPEISRRFLHFYCGACGAAGG